MFLNNLGQHIFNLKLLVLEVIMSLANHSAPFDLNPGDVNEPNGIRFSVSQRYINPTHRQLYVVLRNNLCIRLEPTHQDNIARDYLMVRCVYEFKDLKGITGLADLNQIQLQRAVGLEPNDNTPQEELNKIVTILQNLLLQFNYALNEAKVVINKRIYLNNISDTAWIYDHGLDVVVSTKAVTHPFSVKRKIHERETQYAAGHDVSGVAINIIDNTNKIGSRYIWLAGKIVELPVRKDPTMKDGVYVTFVEQGVSLQDNIKHTEVFDFDKAQSQLGLYPSREQAESHGDSDKNTRDEENKFRLEILRYQTEKLEQERMLSELKNRLEAEIAARDHALKVEQLKHAQELEQVKRDLRSEDIKLEQVKQESEGKSIKRKVVYEKVKHKADKTKVRFEKKKARRDDNYDAQSQSRKTAGDGIKLGAAIFAGIATVAGVTWKLASKITPAGISARTAMFLAPLAAGVVSTAASCAVECGSYVSECARSVRQTVASFFY